MQVIYLLACQTGNPVSRPYAEMSIQVTQTSSCEDLTLFVTGKL